MRLPITLLSIGAVAMLVPRLLRIFRVEKGTDGRRIGLIAALACSTMPLYALLARQAITDTPFVALLTIGDVLLPHRRVRSRGEAPRPLAVLLLCADRVVDPGEGDPLRLRRARRAWCSCYLLLTGRLAAAHAGPAVLGVGAVPRHLRAVRPLHGLHQGHRGGERDLLPPLLAARQLQPAALGGAHHEPQRPLRVLHRAAGLRRLPWSALLPGIVSSGLGIDPKKPEDRSRVFIGLWALVPFLVISLSATKFEHYDLPCMPPLAILCGLYLDKLWRGGCASTPSTCSSAAGCSR